MRFIDEHRKVFTVESICRVLSEHGWAIASSTYRAAVTRSPSLRARRDDELKTAIARVHADNYGVFGARKIWLVLNRQGIRVARCTVERLMRELGLRGVVRSRRTIAVGFEGHGNRQAPCPARRAQRGSQGRCPPMWPR